MSAVNFGTQGGLFDRECLMLISCLIHTLANEYIEVSNYPAPTLASYSWF